MSLSDEQETLATASGSLEQTLRRSARIALSAQAQRAEELNEAILSRVDTFRNVLDDTPEGQRILASFEGFSETQELEPQVEPRASTPNAAILPRGIRIPHRTANSLVRNRVSEFEARSLTDIPTAHYC